MTKSEEIMKRNKIYPDIDMERTGKNLNQRIKEKGYSVREIQSMLHLSCPQPVYRWFKGQILPSVNHLYMLSRILGCHMEDLLVDRKVDIIWEIMETGHNFTMKGQRRLAAYDNWRCQGTLI